MNFAKYLKRFFCFNDALYLARVFGRLRKNSQAKNQGVRKHRGFCGQKIRVFCSVFKTQYRGGNTLNCSAKIWYCFCQSWCLNQTNKLNSPEKHGTKTEQN